MVAAVTLRGHSRHSRANEFLRPRARPSAEHGRAILLLDQDPMLGPEQFQKRVGVIHIKSAAKTAVRQLGIVDKDLPAVVTVELGGYLGKRGGLEDNTALVPCERSRDFIL